MIEKWKIACKENVNPKIGTYIRWYDLFVVNIRYCN